MANIVCEGQRDLILKDGSQVDSLNYYNEKIDSCYTRGVLVRGLAYFRFATFTNDANFQNATFTKKAGFNDTEFMNDAYFIETIFTKNAYFIFAKFRNNADFGRATFRDNAYFRFAKFTNEANFNETIFTNEANFNKTIFTNEANFSNVTFTKYANFGNATFTKYADFSNATFTKYADFSNTQLPDTLRFVSVNTGNEVSSIYLNLAATDSLRKRTADSTRKCVIFLWHTDVSKLVLDHDKFALGFDKDVGLEDRISTYQQVIKSCRDRGLEASAQGFDIDLQKLKLRYSWGGLAPIIIWFQEYWWNFGYDRSRILRNTFYAFTASFLLFLVLFRRFMKAYFPSDQLGVSAEEAYDLCYFRPRWEERFNRLKMVLFYTALVFFSWKMDHSKVNYRQYPWTSLVVYLVYTIGLIHLAYLAAFVIAR